MEHIYTNQEFKVISPYLANSRLTLVTGDLPQKTKQSPTPQVACSVGIELSFLSPNKSRMKLHNKSGIYYTLVTLPGHF